VILGWRTDLGIVYVDGVPFAAVEISSEELHRWVSFRWPARRADLVEILVMHDEEEPSRLAVALMLGDTELTVLDGKLVRVDGHRAGAFHERLLRAVFGVDTPEWSHEHRHPRSARELLVTLLRVSFLPLDTERTV
jgi:hypothetical protein